MIPIHRFTRLIMRFLPMILSLIYAHAFEIQQPIAVSGQTVKLVTLLRMANRSRFSGHWTDENSERSLDIRDILLYEWVLSISSPKSTRHDEYKKSGTILWWGQKGSQPRTKSNSNLPFLSLTSFCFLQATVMDFCRSLSSVHFHWLVPSYFPSPNDRFTNISMPSSLRWLSALFSQIVPSNYCQRFVSTRERFASSSLARSSRLFNFDLRNQEMNRKTAMTRQPIRTRTMVRSFRFISGNCCSLWSVGSFLSVTHTLLLLWIMFSGLLFLRDWNDAERLHESSKSKE